MGITPEEPISSVDQRVTRSLGRETLNLFSGRGVNLVISIAALILFPRILGPQAHGVLQYYLGLFLLLLGFFNGCAAPMIAHFIAIYRVSDPPRQQILVRQVIRWFLLVVGIVWTVRFLLHNPIMLRNPAGFWWLYLGVALAGVSQLLASGQYGLGRLGPATWFPVLNLFLRIVIICSTGHWIYTIHGAEIMESWGEKWIPIILLLTAVPSLIWMVVSFLRCSSEWKVEGVTAISKLHFFPWEEIKILGIAALVGQLIYQTFTRSLVPIAEELGYPIEEIGYLGLSIQAFGLVVYLAGIFSVSVYPWLVSAQTSGESERFSSIQAEAWRLTAVIGGLLGAGIIGLARPIVWVGLGEEYHGDIDLMVGLIRICALAGIFMLPAEFHLRMLLSVTRMKAYLAALILGFSVAIPYLGWVILAHKDILTYSFALPLGVASLMVVSIFLAPKTVGFTRVTSLSTAGGAIALACSAPLEGDTISSLLVQAGALTLVYCGWVWLTGLVSVSDIARILRFGKPAPPEEGQ